MIFDDDECIVTDADNDDIPDSLYSHKFRCLGILIDSCPNGEKGPHADDPDGDGCNASEGIDSDSDGD